MILAPRVIPIDYVGKLAQRLDRDAVRPWFVYLDSCADRAVGGGRFDIISAAPRVTLTTRGERTEIRSGDVTRVSDADPFELLSEHLGAQTDAADDRLPFTGGAIGYFSYDLGRRIEALPSHAAQDIDIPDMAIGIYDWAAVIDHERCRAYLVVNSGCEIDVDHWIGVLTAAEPLTPAAYGTSFQVTSAVQADICYADYARAFARVKRYILDGDCYQVNLAQRFSATVTGNAWDAYRRLRNLNPAPFSAYLRYENAAVLSSSPERFIQVANRWVETKPIKGTRPRSADPHIDRALIEELLKSEKDRAENLMIVDLLRNDLGKTCVVGTVTVPEMFNIESFATVHHLVSTVRGELAGGMRASDVLRGCFPGGSITGAPKLRAMQIIEELEPVRRTVYCGAIGYLSYCGQMDTNIAIRTLVHRDDRMYCWAGGGIVADSDVDAEYQECLDKAAAMLDVLIHAEAQHLGR